MNLQEAKEIVKGMYPGSFVKTSQMTNKHLHNEAILLVSKAACEGDKEAAAIQSCIPSEMSFMGLYPHVQLEHRIVPDDVLDELIDIRNEKRMENAWDILDEMKKSRYND